MNAALFDTAFFRVAWVTKRRRRLFRSLEDRRAAQLWVCEIAKSKGLRAHQVTAQGARLHALFELPPQRVAQAAELFASVKAGVERALLTIKPELTEIWDPCTFCERVDPRAGEPAP